MQRVSSPDGDEWTVYVDATGPRFRWRPSTWWRNKDSATETPIAPAATTDAGTADDEDQKKRRWYDWIDIPDFGFDDLHITLIILGAIAAVVLVFLLFGWVVLPLLVVLLDIAVLAIGTATLFIWRTATRAGWTVIATSEQQPERRWRAKGWRAARRAERDIAAALQYGVEVSSANADEITA